MKYVILVSYDGTDFCGWQNQPAQRSVQGVLEEAAGRVFSAPVKVTASGRTDAGVHALGQVAELSGDTAIPAEKLAVCLNLQLPPDVRVLSSAAAPQGFDVTRGAKRKTYCYRAYYAECEIPLLNRYAIRLSEKPSVEKMRAASALLVGEHDFSAFRSSGFTSKTSVRTLYSVTVEEKEEELYTEYTLSVTGNGFLYNMVRIIAGELFAVGLGKTEGITRAFATGERSTLSKTLPPQGLLLKNVEYEVPLFGTKR